MSNLLEISKGMKPLIGLAQYHILENQGFKIGFLGFAEEDWLETFPPDIDCTDIKYIDYNE